MTEFITFSPQQHAEYCNSITSICNSCCTDWMLRTCNNHVCCHYQPFHLQYTVCSSPAFSTGFKFFESILEICNISTNEGGQYICQASNGNGVVTNTTTLTIVQVVHQENWRHLLTSKNEKPNLNMINF